MKKIEFENLSKDELFEKIKAEYAQKAKHNFVKGIVFGLLCLAMIIFEAYYFFTKGDSLSFSFVLLFAITLVMCNEKCLLFLRAKKLVKAENAEEMLSLYDTFNLKAVRWFPLFPFIAVAALFFNGYVIYDMIATTNIERFGVVLFWLIIAFLVLCFIFLIFLLMFIIAIIKGNAKKIGWKDEPPIAHLRELVEKEKQDSL